VELAVPSAPSAEIVIMLLAVKRLESLRLIDLSIAALNFCFQRRTKLVHLAIILRGEDFLLLGQLAVKF
jgi:hypothetical protein